MGWLPRLLKPRRDATGGSDEGAMGLVHATGDPAAFAGLVGRWEEPIRRLCVRMTGDEHRGEDLAQETFARVFANRHRYDAGRRFSTWLWRVALNVCYEHSRRTKARGGDHGELPLDGDNVSDGGALAARAPSDPPEAAAAAERAQLVRAALAELPEAHRTVVVLREYENLKFREIADVLNVPEGTVKWRMAEAMDRLGRQLRPVLAGDDDDVTHDDTKRTAATPAAADGDDAQLGDAAGRAAVARVTL